MELMGGTGDATWCRSPVSPPAFSSEGSQAGRKRHLIQLPGGSSAARALAFDDAASERWQEGPIPRGTGSSHGWPESPPISIRLRSRSTGSLISLPALSGHADSAQGGFRLAAGGDCRGRSEASGRSLPDSAERLQLIQLRMSWPSRGQSATAAHHLPSSEVLSRGLKRTADSALGEASRRLFAAAAAALSADRPWENKRTSIDQQQEPTTLLPRRFTGAPSASVSYEPAAAIGQLLALPPPLSGPSSAVGPVRPLEDRWAQASGPNLTDTGVQAGGEDQSVGPSEAVILPGEPSLGTETPLQLKSDSGRGCAVTSSSFVVPVTVRDRQQAPGAPGLQGQQLPASAMLQGADKPDGSHAAASTCGELINPQDVRILMDHRHFQPAVECTKNEDLASLAPGPSNGNQQQRAAGDTSFTADRSNVSSNGAGRRNAPTHSVVPTSPMSPLTLDALPGGVSVRDTETASVPVRSQTLGDSFDPPGSLEASATSLVSLPEADASAPSPSMDRELFSPSAEVTPAAFGASDTDATPPGFTFTLSPPTPLDAPSSSSLVAATRKPSRPIVDHQPVSLGQASQGPHQRQQRHLGGSTQQSFPDEAQGRVAAALDVVHGRGTQDAASDGETWGDHRRLQPRGETASRMTASRTRLRELVLQRAPATLHHRGFVQPVLATQMPWEEIRGHCNPILRGRPLEQATFSMSFNGPESDSSRGGPVAAPISDDIEAAASELHRLKTLRACLLGLRDILRRRALDQERAAAHFIARTASRAMSLWAVAAAGRRMAALAVSAAFRRRRLITVCWAKWVRCLAAGIRLRGLGDLLAAASRRRCLATAARGWRRLTARQILLRANLSAAKKHKVCGVGACGLCQSHKSVSPASDYAILPNSILSVLNDPAHQKSRISYDPSPP